MIETEFIPYLDECFKHQAEDIDQILDANNFSEALDQIEKMN